MLRGVALFWRSARFLDAGRTKIAVLASAAGSALVLIVHSVLG